MNTDNRPLSPHLQIYKPQMTSGLSILHRISGVVLTGGSLIFVIWLVALAGGPETYGAFLSYARAWYGQIILFGLTAAFFYHLCNGIRHLLWDLGLFIDIKGAYKTGRLTVAVSATVTLLIWLQIYGII